MRCLIVDDNAEYLAAARRLLVREGIDVVGVASTTAEAIARAEELRPDVMLVDVDLGEENGFDLVLQISRDGDHASPCVVLISTHAEDDLADLVAASPAAGFVGKSELSRRAIDDVLAR